LFFAGAANASRPAFTGNAVPNVNGRSNVVNSLPPLTAVCVIVQPFRPGPEYG
jgi:hypothetical protein